ncbi:integral membrane protein [Cordyceps fumosorosea ARSEF 2679]|uniref:Integral membrane protein n=1 Tax=Cordyceps fumosorosea (strain ARSEF 2679) TaxID=1081104 RepID=A0A167XF50_CORFA|nr:integral membrane protein [Cordyceps fumosorosea ARSEF 2679]OAA64904.1 integral membrane protein [Cordyceps fumosorosea ARSEF 2679]
MQPCRRHTLARADSHLLSLTLTLEPSPTTHMGPWPRDIFTQPTRPARSRRRQRNGPMTTFPWLVYALMALLLAAVPVSAVRVPFTNCLDEKYIAAKKLEWQPVWADARFDVTDPRHMLEVTVWGNVTGSQDPSNPPPTLREDPNRLYWKDDAKTNGKIIQTANPNAAHPNATTLYRRVDVLTYRPVNERVFFCSQALIGGQCPLGPYFNTSPMYVTSPIPSNYLLIFASSDFPNNLTTLPSSLSSFPSMNLTHDFGSSYSFSSFSSTLLLLYGDEGATNIGCISSIITPDLGPNRNVIKFLPLVILIICGFAVIFAGNFSPWGSTDIFQWSSNYGRDADQLRLVTPGFGDCLQYMQFAVLTGALSIGYPGFYQPIVSQAAWSTIMFNESFVTNKPGWRNVVDGIYVTSLDNKYGMQHMSQLVGMADDQDIWAGMMVWLCVIILAAFIVVQFGFLIQWVYRRSTKTAEEDLRAKNIPFSIGNVVRILYNYMLLPIVAFSAYQLVIAESAPVYCVVLACMTLVVLIGFAAYLLYLIVTTRPKSVLFDDLPTVLRFGPLYNTYSDEAATFAFIPLVLQFCRGLAIGAVQPSGLAQIVILAICEVIQIFTLNAVKPFQSPTSMNAYHTVFSCLRLITILLMVAFVPGLGVSEGPKGWIGYAILIVHACVLVFGFLVSALGTILEVVARMMGAGRDSTVGSTRGGLSKIFGVRQLNKRESHRAIPSRISQLSTAAMIDTEKANRAGYMPANGRVRSSSGGSLGTIMAANRHRSSSVLDSVDVYSNAHRPADSPASYLPGTPGETSTFSFLATPNTAARSGHAHHGHQSSIATLEAADPYYRPPRRRRSTNENLPQEPVTGHFTPDQPGLLQPPGAAGEPGDAAADISRGATPVAPGTGLGPPGTTMAALNAVPNRPDYSTREVDFYYGVRGPALNSDSLGRKLGTGPADPTGPIATATGWFRNFMGGKSKDKSKGFEVVRSSRMPPAMARNAGFGDETPPEGIPVALGVLRKGPIDDEDEDDNLQPNRAPKPTATLLSARDKGHDSGDEDAAHGPGEREPISPVTSDDEDDDDGQVSTYYDAPDIPRKSSKRDSVNISPHHMPALSVVDSQDAGSSSHARDDGSERAHRRIASHSSNAPKLPNLPFERTKSQKRLSSMSSMDFRDGFTTVDLNTERPASYGMVSQHSISRVATNPRATLHSSSAELVDENGVPKMHK